MLPFGDACLRSGRVDGLFLCTGLIAQLAERVADNDEVSGSSPDGPSTYEHLRPAVGLLISTPESDLGCSVFDKGDEDGMGLGAHCPVRGSRGLYGV